MQSANNESKELVISYIRALDAQNYEDARNYLSDNIRIRGPAGETFGNSKQFVDMLKRYQGKYDVKKIFSDSNDVCLIYDLITNIATVFTCSWYTVDGGKISSIQTIFDPTPFRAQM